MSAAAARSGGIDFGALRCVSLVDELAENAAIHVERSRSTDFVTRIDVVRADDVLYVPLLRLQLVGRGVVPREAVPEPWTLGFEIKRGFQGQAEQYRGPFDRVRSDEEVCILSNFYSRNFYHWVLEELPKVLILERHGFSGRYVIANLPAFAGEFMGMLGVAVDRLITELDQPTIFRTALYTTSIHGFNLLQHEDVILSLRDALVGGVAPTGRSTRLWIDRGAGARNPGRELVNREEVQALLARYGFEAIDMGSIALREQVAAAHQASALAGPHGAGFVHVLFQKHGSSVIECFSPQFINPCVFDLCRLMRHRYSMLVHGNAYDAYPYGDRIKIDCSHLALVLQSLQ